MEHSRLSDEEERLVRRHISTRRLIEVIERTGHTYDVTPETTTDLELVTELARHAIQPYANWTGRIDEVRASGWHNID